MATEYDLVILGGGPGGYVAAIRAVQLGLKTAVVEKENLGGTCLHRGCVPSKALLKSAEIFATAKRAEQFGIFMNDVAFDFEKAQARKDEVVEQLHRGVIHLMKKGKIDVYAGIGRILGPSIFSPTCGTISVEMNDGTDNEMLIPKNVLIATGSRPRMLEGVEFDGQYVLSSDDALSLKELPTSMLIVGGGVIGVEWASLLADLGVSVTIVEMGERMLPLEDAEISKEAERLLKKKGIKVVKGARLLPESLQKSEVVKVRVEHKGEEKEFQAEKLLVTIGRAANVEGIGLENTNIQVVDGCIETNEFYQTAESHIYAIGDVIGGMQLAHVASREGVIAAEHMAGVNPELLHYDMVPSCVYSSPEIASVGLTEQEAVERGYDVKTGKLLFKAIGKALINGNTDGFVKIVSDKKTDDLLGVHMIGANVTELISEAALAKVLDAANWEVAETIRPHPSLSEIIGEAALAVDGRAIHS